MIYCLDTSSLIQPWNQLYPIDVAPPFWKKVEDWINDGRLIAPEEVLVEIQKVDDELLAWLKQRKSLFQPPNDDVQRAVREILKNHARLVDTKKGRSIADPWVIAQAKVSNAIVVTEEHAARGKSPKIPDVCEAMNVRYTNVLGLIRAMELKFR
jgi:predicted nucleic acid-binding protein